VDYQIEFARSDAELELRGILLDSDMDIAGDIREHVLIKQREEIVGGGMLTQTGPDVFHLIVFAVKESARGNGIGSVLIQDLLWQPWAHCHNSTGELQESYRVTTISKGKSAAFYRKNGFAACDFSEVAEPYRGQCAECPEKVDCQPVAMSYRGGSPALEPARG
jgi:N-acetylglutamate synthase-like GNAT family acetyltransferase